MLLSGSPLSNRLIWPSVTVGKGTTNIFLLSSYFSFVSQFPIRSSSKGQARNPKRAKRPRKQKLKIQYARLGKAHNQKDARKSCLGFLYKFSPIQCGLAPSRLLQSWESASKTGFCVYVRGHHNNSTFRRSLLVRSELKLQSSFLWLHP